jgi:hypothetical protein
VLIAGAVLAFALTRSSETETAELAGYRNIDITADGISVDGATIATLDAVRATPGKIEALADRLRAPKGTPWLLRPERSTPIDVLMAVMITARVTSAKLVLAVNRDGVWKPLRSTPVPSTKTDGETLSILWTSDALWFGITRSGEFTRIESTGGTFDHAAVSRVLATLPEHHVKTIEVGVEAPVEFGDLVELLDVVIAAGFADWALVEPAALSARPAM